MRAVCLFSLGMYPIKFNLRTIYICVNSMQHLYLSCFKITVQISLLKYGEMINSELHSDTFNAARPSSVVRSADSTLPFCPAEQQSVSQSVRAEKAVRRLPSQRHQTVGGGEKPGNVVVASGKQHRPNEGTPTEKDRAKGAVIFNLPGPPAGLGCRSTRLGSLSAWLISLALRLASRTLRRRKRGETGCQCCSNLWQTFNNALFNSVLLSPPERALNRHFTGEAAIALTAELTSWRGGGTQVFLFLFLIFFFFKAFIYLFFFFLHGLLRFLPNRTRACRFWWLQTKNWGFEAAC